MSRNYCNCEENMLLERVKEISRWADENTYSKQKEQRLNDKVETLEKEIKELKWLVMKLIDKTNK